MSGGGTSLKARSSDSAGGLIFYEGQNTSLKPVKIQYALESTLHVVDAADFNSKTF